MHYWILYNFLWCYIHSNTALLWDQCSRRITLEYTYVILFKVTQFMSIFFMSYNSFNDKSIRINILRGYVSISIWVGKAAPCFMITISRYTRRWLKILCFAFALLFQMSLRGNYLFPLCGRSRIQPSHCLFASIITLYFK